MLPGGGGREGAFALPARRARPFTRESVAEMVAAGLDAVDSLTAGGCPCPCTIFQ